MHDDYEFAQQHDIDCCSFCRFDFDCSHKVTSNAAGDPCFPPCSDGYSNVWVDDDLLAEKVAEYKEDNKDDA